MFNKIKKVIEHYLENNTRSEEEVRSKLIVPLTEALGYPLTFRGEDFPVYSFHGRKQLPRTSADFILFNDEEYNKYSNYTYEDTEWVKNHSLLVIEAKKPDAMPEVQGQAQFYTMWVRAVAYLVTDGKQIKGWLLKNGCADELIIDAELNNYSELSKLLQFSYDSLSQIKDECIDSEDVQIINDVSELDVPPDIINDIRDVMGKNADGLDDLKLLSSYFASCDFILQNELRYGIPQYALDLPREIVDANLYIDNRICPIISGTLFHSYWENIDIYQFDSEIIHVTLTYLDGNLLRFESEYSSLYDDVSNRIDGLKRIIEIVSSKRIIICVNDDELQKQLFIDNSNNKTLNKQNRRILKLIEFWLEGLSQMKEIESFYGVSFVLGEVEDVLGLYHDVEMIYDGFHMLNNCTLTIPYKENVYTDIETPIILHDGDIPDMADKTIFGITFKPCKTILLPGKHKRHVLSNTIEMSVCCEYKLLKDL